MECGGERDQRTLQPKSGYQQRPRVWDARIRRLWGQPAIVAPSIAGFDDFDRGSELRACEFFENQTRRLSRSEFDPSERVRIDLVDAAKG